MGLLMLSREVPDIYDPDPDAMVEVEIEVVFTRDEPDPSVGIFSYGLSDYQVIWTSSDLFTPDQAQCWLDDGSYTGAPADARHAFNRLCDAAAADDDGPDPDEVYRDWKDSRYHDSP